MKRKISIVLLLTVLATVGFSAKKTRFSPLPDFNKAPSKPVKEEYSEEKEILNYIKKEGYNPKSEIRKTTDQTMEENIKEVFLLKKQGRSMKRYIKLQRLFLLNRGLWKT